MASPAKGIAQKFIYLGKNNFIPACASQMLLTPIGALGSGLGGRVELIDSAKIKAIVSYLNGTLNS